jgi:hypothetical protein
MKKCKAIRPQLYPKLRREVDTYQFEEKHLKIGKYAYKILTSNANANDSFYRELFIKEECYFNNSGFAFNSENDKLYVNRYFEKLVEKNGEIFPQELIYRSNTKQNDIRKVILNKKNLITGKKKNSKRKIKRIKIRKESEHDRDHDHDRDNQTKTTTDRLNSSSDDLKTESYDGDNLSSYSEVISSKISDNDDKENYYADEGGIF